MEVFCAQVGTVEHIAAVHCGDFNFHEASAALQRRYPSFLWRNPPKHPPCLLHRSSRFGCECWTLFELRRIHHSHSSMGQHPRFSAKADKTDAALSITTFSYSAECWNIIACGIFVTHPIIEIVMRISFTYIYWLFWHIFGKSTIRFVTVSVIL